MKKLLPSTQRGQALIIITLAAIGLFAITGLAIDGSAKFSDRRHAQNAADTAVLAGALARARAQEQAETDPVTWTADAIRIAMEDAARDRADDNGYDGNLITNQVWIYSCDDIDLTSPGDCGPYNDDSKYIEVVIESHVNTFFARVIGITQTHNTVRSIAVAGKLSGSSIAYDPNVFRALWAGASSGCTQEKYFDWGGNQYIINGGVHSNGYMNIPGNLHDVAGTSTVAQTQSGGGTGTVFDPALQQNTNTMLSNPFASEYTFSRFNTGGDIYAAAAAVNRIVVTSSNINISWLKESCYIAGVKCYNEGSKVLQDGIYVTTSASDVSIDLSESNIVTDDPLDGDDFVNATFVSQRGGIKLSGSDNKFKTYIGNAAAKNTTSFLINLHGILFATWWDRGGGSSQCTDYVISTSGNAHQFQGFFYAPNGQLELNGNYETILGCTIAYTTKLNGSNSSISCDDTWFPSAGPYTIGIMQ